MLRVNKWMVLSFYICFFLLTGYMSISEFVNDGHFGWLMGACSLMFAYQTVIYFKKSKREGWNDKEVVADQRIINTILVSLSLSYIYLFLFLLIGIITIYNDFGYFNPLNMAIVATFTSSIVFGISQIVQRFLR